MPPSRLPHAPHSHSVAQQNLPLRPNPIPLVNGGLIRHVAQFRIPNDRRPFWLCPGRGSELWHRLLRRSAAESGRLRHGDGAPRGRPPPEGASVGYALLVAWTIMVAGNHPGARALCWRGDARRALEAGGTSRRAAPAAVRDKLCISSARASWVMDERAQALQVNPAS